MSDKKDASGAQNIIHYISKDELFLKNIHSEFKKYFPDFGVEIKQIFEEDSSKIQSIIHKIILDQPAIIYIEFTNHTKEYLHLARVLCRLNSTKNIAIVGLVDQKAEPSMIHEVFLTGVKINHIKSGEMHGVVFDAMAMAFPEKTEEHKFAAPQLNDETYLYGQVKISKVNESKIIIETNRPLDSNEEIKLHNHWCDKLAIIPSNRMFVVSQWSEGLFYNFQYGAELEFAYVDVLEAAEGESQAVLDKREALALEQLEEAKEKLTTWIEENKTESSPKSTRLLVIEQELSFYNDQERADQYPYIIRCQPYLEDEVAEVNKIRPQLIFFQLQDEAKENEEESTAQSIPITNTDKALKRLMQAISTIENYQPFVVVFNCNISSQQAQSFFKYDKILTYNASLKPNIVIQMADMLNKKFESKYQQSNQDAIILDKNNPASIAEIMLPAKIMKISEADVTIECNHHLEEYSTYRMNNPVDMYVTIVPSKNKMNPGQYYGLLNGISENDKMKLRKFIHSVFFREKEAKRKAEQEMNNALKQAALQKRQEEAQKSSENKKS